MFLFLEGARSRGRKVIPFFWCQGDVQNLKLMSFIFVLRTLSVYTVFDGLLLFSVFCVLKWTGNFSLGFYLLKLQGWSLPIHFPKHLFNTPYQLNSSISIRHFSFYSGLLQTILQVKRKCLRLEWVNPWT